MSWYSSTLNQRFRARMVLGGVGVVLEQADGLDEEVVEVDPALAGLGALVVLEGADEQVDRDRRLATRRDAGDLALVVARPDPARLRPLDLVGQVLRRREPEVPGELPRRAGRGSGSWSRAAGAAARPSWRDGQKSRSWLSAWAWNVRAVTPGSPSDRSRSTISPAALSVNVTTSTWSGGTTSVAIAYAVRRLITRVLPVPAPARIATGPLVASTASRCSGSRSSSRRSGSSRGISRG